MKGGNDDRISFLGELLKITCKTNNQSSFDTLVCLIIIKLFKIQYMTVSFSLMCSSLVVCPCSHQSIVKTTSTLWRITQRLLFTLPRGMDISRQWSGLSRVVRTLTGQPMNSPVPSLQVNSKYLGSQSQIMLTMCIFPLLSLVIYLSHFLFLAVDGGHKDMVELLVENGAEVNGTYSVSGWSCLHQAVYKVIALIYNSNLRLMLWKHNNLYKYYIQHALRSSAALLTHF